MGEALYTVFDLWLCACFGFGVFVIARNYVRIVRAVVRRTPILECEVEVFTGAAHMSVPLLCVTMIPGSLHRFLIATWLIDVAPWLILTIARGVRWVVRTRKVH